MDERARVLRWAAPTIAVAAMVSGCGGAPAEAAPSFTQAVEVPAHMAQAGHPCTDLENTNRGVPMALTAAKCDFEDPLVPLTIVTVADATQATAAVQAFEEDMQDQKNPIEASYIQGPNWVIQAGVIFWTPGNGEEAREKDTQREEKVKQLAQALQGQYIEGARPKYIPGL